MPIDEDQIKKLHRLIVDKYNGKCSGKCIEDYLDEFECLEDLTAYPNLFWMARSSYAEWEIRAKVNVRLCGDYLDNSCFYNCGCLHLCKRFLCSAKFCSGYCSLSHDLNDAHNSAVVDIIKQQNQIIVEPNLSLLRSSFPRMCGTFQKKGTCNKFFCGYIHICPDFVFQKCTGKCKLIKNIDRHNWSSKHNQTVLRIFNLSFSRGERNILLTNFSFLEDPNINEVDLASETSSECSEVSVNFNESHNRKTPLILCSDYLDSICEKSPCRRFHFCKEFIINGNKCNAYECKYNLSHDPLDTTNKVIMKKHNWDDLPLSDILEKIRNSFPRICKSYELNKTCCGEDCSRIHICPMYLRECCHNENCDYIHDFKDSHNLKVLSKFSLDKIKARKHIIANILFSKVISKGLRDNFKDGLISHEDKEVILSGSLQPHCSDSLISAPSKVEKGPSTQDARGFAERRDSIQMPLILCSYYLNGVCNQKPCKRLHFCKEYIVSINNCNASQCKYGFSHDPLDSNNFPIMKAHNWDNLPLPSILRKLRLSFPRLCNPYGIKSISKKAMYGMRERCVSEDCTKIHICPLYLLEHSCTDDCEYSHDFKDTHNMKVLSKFSLDKVTGRKYITTNILFSKISLNLYTDRLIAEKSQDIVNEEFSNKSYQPFNNCIEIEDKPLATMPREQIVPNPNEQDIFLFIMKSSSPCGKCPLLDENLLAFFDKDKSHAKNWFAEHNSTFRLTQNEKSEVIVYVCLNDVEPCRFYWRKDGCGRKHCNMFHICRRWLMGIQHSSISCHLNHDFSNPHAKTLITGKLKALNDYQLLVLLRYRYPYVCMEYVENHCTLGDEICANLHVCYDFMIRKCKKQDGVCQYKHELALESEQAHRIMRDFHLTVEKFKYCIMCPYREEEKYIVKKVTETKALNFLKEAAVCHYYLVGECKSEAQCHLHHPQGNQPYLWQYRFRNGGAWISLCSEINRSLEKQYCDPAIQDGRAGEYSVSFAHHLSYPFGFVGEKVNEGIDFRRLSTASSVEVEARLGLTEWKWFWQKSPNVWEEYSNWVTSEDIERHYLENSVNIPMQFKTDEFTYTICFQKMIQKNLDERYRTERSIIRRPLFKNSVQPSIENSHPSHWPRDCSSVKRIKVQRATYAKLKAQFESSIGIKMNVKSIEEICNVEFYEKFEAKKRSLLKKIGKADERLLYHGTEFGIVSAICAQNFDWRLCGKNATAYGQGSYFARDASYSHNYSTEDTDGIRYMFIANVLIGRFTKGSSSMKRPPIIPSEEHELYDSCVDNINDPSIFVIFERDQCYPRYLIAYTDRIAQSRHNEVNYGTRVSNPISSFSSTTSTGGISIRTNVPRYASSTYNATSSSNVPARVSAPVRSVSSRTSASNLRSSTSNAASSSNSLNHPYQGFAASSSASSFSSAQRSHSQGIDTPSSTPAYSSAYDRQYRQSSPQKKEKKQTCVIS